MINFEDFIISQKTLDKLKNQAALLHCLEDGESLQEILGFSDEVLLEFYAVAKDILEKKDMRMRLKAFLF